MALVWKAGSAFCYISWMIVLACWGALWFRLAEETSEFMTEVTLTLFLDGCIVYWKRHRLKNARRSCCV